MGFLDDMFNFGAPEQPRQEQSSGGFLDSLFNFGGKPSGGSVYGGSSYGGSARGIDSLFGGPTEEEPLGGPFSYREPVLPLGTQARGRGDQFFGTKGEADKSELISGVVTDPDTGYVGTPAQIYDRYLSEGRNPARLVERYRKRWPF